MLPLQKPSCQWRIAQEPKRGAPDVGADWQNADNQTLYPFNAVQNYAARSQPGFFQLLPDYPLRFRTPG